MFAAKSANKVGKTKEEVQQAKKRELENRLSQVTDQLSGNTAAAPVAKGRGAKKGQSVIFFSPALLSAISLLFAPSFLLLCMPFFTFDYFTTFLLTTKTHSLTNYNNCLSVLYVL